MDNIRIVAGTADDREHAEYDDQFGECVLKVYPNPNTYEPDPKLIVDAEGSAPDGSAWFEIDGTSNAAVLDYDQLGHLYAYIKHIMETAE
jgi:hypothetical protein